MLREQGLRVIEEFGARVERRGKRLRKSRQESVGLRFLKLAQPGQRRMEPGLQRRVVWVEALVLSQPRKLIVEEIDLLLAGGRLHGGAEVVRRPGRGSGGGRRARKGKCRILRRAVGLVAEAEAEHFDM